MSNHVAELTHRLHRVYNGYDLSIITELAKDGESFISYAVVPCGRKLWADARCSKAKSRQEACRLVLEMLDEEAYVLCDEEPHEPLCERCGSVKFMAEVRSEAEAYGYISTSPEEAMRLVSEMLDE